MSYTISFKQLAIMHVLITNHAFHHDFPGHPAFPPQKLWYDTHILDPNLILDCDYVPR